MRLRASQLTKNFGHSTIVKNVDIAVAPGEVVTIFGPNGAGKTTLLKILSTLLRPTSGGFEIEGTDAVLEPLKVRNALGVVLHEPSAYTALSPYENLKFFGNLYGVERLAERCRTLLAEVGLSRFVHEPLRIFSRGMTQRFMIARALLHDPVVLLFDEPFSGLDTSAKQFVLQRIAQEQQKGKAIIVTTHNVELGYIAGSRFCFMCTGQLQIGPDKSDIDSEALSHYYEEILRTHPAAA